ncbi:MAG: multiheme c-type cytochrome [Myxococcota bacterium]
MLLHLLAACHPEPPPDHTGTTPDTVTETGAGPVEVHDPLSMPDTPTLDPADFAAADDCAGCHPDHAAEWRTSMHRYAMVDPVFQALVAVRQEDLAGLEDQFCVQCHSAIGTRGGEIVAGFSFDDLSPITMEGITCTSCHAITEVVRDYDSGHVLDPAAPIQGPIHDAASGDAHASAYNPLFEDSLLCGGCHDVVETDGLDLERPYREWTQSPSAVSGQTCQDCHMRSIERPAATDGPVRTTHEHRWVGVDVPLVDGFMTPAEEAELRAGTRELLTGVATLDLGAPAAVHPGTTVDLTVSITNEIPGHNLPTGSTFLRQVWLDLVATDATGRELYRTGQLDANGDLEDYWSALAPFGDPDLISLSSGFVDGTGARTVFPWIADEHASGAIPPGYTRTWTLFVPTDPTVVGPITVHGTVRFRALAPYLLRLVGMEDAIPAIEIHALAEDTLEVGLAAD